MKFNKSIILFYLGLGLITISYLLLLWLKREQLDFQFSYHKLSQIYQISQIRLGNEASITMYDPQLYQFAGYTYLTEGRIEEINVEHPPLGKYFYGLSAIFLGNPLIIQLIFGYILLLLTFYLSFDFCHKSFLSLLPPFLLIVDGLFFSQISQTELDLPLTVAVFAFLTFNLKRVKVNAHFSLINGFLLGLIASIKFPSTALLMWLTYFIWLLVFRNKNIVKNMIITTTIIVLTFVLMYLPLIIEKGLTVFWQTQLQAIHIQLSHLPNYPPLAALRVLLFNQWRVWFDAQNLYQNVSVWNIFWPISTLIFILSIIRFKNVQKQMILAFAFTCMYLLFINLRLFFPRYLIQILPLFYIFSACYLYDFVTKNKMLVKLKSKLLPKNL